MRARLKRLLLERAPRLFLALFRPNDRELGELGEELAARHFADEGWRIIGRRVRTRHAEIDLLCRAGKTLLCVEVKTGRRSALARPRFRPADRVRRRSLARQRRAARELCRETRGVSSWRVDLFELTVTSRFEPLELRHLRDVGFRPD